MILEPVVGNMGTVVPTSEFLSTLQEQCRKSGALLIFDEVMTGFRVALGGAQERFGVTPDLCTLGKIIGGGLPVGAYAGRADVMETVSPVGPVYQAGTLSGNPLAMASGLATLRTLRDTNPYPLMEERSVRLAKGLSSAATAAGIDHQIGQVGSMFTLFFNPDPVNSYTIAARSDTQRFADYFWGMIRQGIYLPCSQYEAVFVSAAHSDADIDETITAAEHVLDTL